MKADLSQLAAIKHGPGPALVSAGPGSGKTYVLTHRILYLIQNLGVSPDQILVLTFSKKAAEEMEKRFLSLYGRKQSKVTFGTFHSVFLRILHNYGRFRDFRVLSETEEIYLMYKAMKAGKSSLLTEEYAEQSVNRYHALKAKDMVTDDMVIFRKYELLKEREKLFDYDDMLYETRLFLKANRDVLREIQEKFRFILIDEFQDINPVQYEIIGMICERHKNIFAVGDDDQSIYAFRGATPAVMQNFLKDYEDVKEYHLYRNYRSKRRIVKCAGKVIKKNQNRIRKKIVSNSKENGNVKYRILRSKKKEFDSLAKDLQKNIGICMKKYGKTGAHAILLRTNRIPPELINALKENGLEDAAGIMTMHASKGLEFDYVYLPDLYEGNVPYRLSKTREEKEEERRVFYVAMTRAKQGLYLYGLWGREIKSEEADMAILNRITGIDFNKKTGKHKISRFFIDSL